MNLDFLTRAGGIAIASIACVSAHADFLGWTANVRTVETGGFFVDVFAVMNQGDGLLNVYGGYPGYPGVGYVATTASGGFRQSPDEAAAAWRPNGNQGWNTRDSFLTIGGGFNAGNWSGNGSTLGDPFWTVNGVDTFNTAGVANANNVPFTAGWYIAGSVAQSRSLESLQNRAASSSAAAAEGMRGVLVAHLYIADPNWSIVLWDMSASVRRTDGSVHQGSGAFQLQIPAPGALAVIGGALAVPSRRRRAA
jgi:hypothetical protein